MQSCNFSKLSRPSSLSPGFRNVPRPFFYRFLNSKNEEVDDIMISWKRLKTMKHLFAAKSFDVQNIPKFFPSGPSQAKSEHLSRLPPTFSNPETPSQSGQNKQARASEKVRPKNFQVALSAIECAFCIGMLSSLPPHFLPHFLKPSKHPIYKAVWI